MNTSTVRTDESRARAERNHAEARNGPPAGLGVGLILILLAAGLLAFERYALSPHAIDQVGWDWWRQAAERIGPWPRRIGLICLGGGVGLTVAWLVRSVRYRMRRQAVEMITQVAANLLKIDRQQLRLCRGEVAQWTAGVGPAALSPPAPGGPGQQSGAGIRAGQPPGRTLFGDLGTQAPALHDQAATRSA